MRRTQALQAKVASIRPIGPRRARSQASLRSQISHRRYSTDSSMSTLNL